MTRSRGPILESEPRRLSGRIAPRTAMAEKAMTALIEALRVDDNELKIATIEALAHFGPAAAPAVPAVVRIMNEARASKDDRLVISSAETLAKIGPKDVAGAAIGTLRELAEQGNAYIRDVANRILKELKATE